MDEKVFRAVRLHAKPGITCPSVIWTVTVGVIVLAGASLAAADIMFDGMTISSNFVRVRIVNVQKRTLTRIFYLLLDRGRFVSDRGDDEERSIAWRESRYCPFFPRGFARFKLSNISQV